MFTRLVPAALFSIAALATGCVSATARFAAGPTATSEGEVGVQAGVAVGFGYANSDTSAVNGSFGIAGGSTNALELTDTIEYVSVDRDSVGYRVGVNGRIPLAGDQLGLFGEAGVMFPVLYSRTSGGHEKSFQTTTTKVLAVGLRARLGMASSLYDASDEGARPAFGADVTIDWLLFSRMR